MQNGSCGHDYNINKNWQWDITKFMNNQRKFVKYAVISLNRPIPQNIDFFKRFWNNGELLLNFKKSFVFYSI